MLYATGLEQWLASPVAYSDGFEELLVGVTNTCRIMNMLLYGMHGSFAVCGDGATKAF